MAILQHLPPDAGSRPARGAWIEIHYVRHFHPDAGSRPARGAWIEIKNLIVELLRLARRAPHGARGLKFYGAKKHVKEKGVAPRTGRVD